MGKGRYAKLLALLEGAINKKGWSEAEACRRAGLKVDAIRTLRRGNAPKPEKLKAFARALGLDEQILFAAIDAPAPADDYHLPSEEVLGEEPERDEPPAPLSQRGGAPSVAIRELDVRAHGGDGQILHLNESIPTTGEWTIPTTILRSRTSAPTKEMRIITVYGDSMAPDFQAGDRILVDCSDTRPSPPGVFVIWDGFGLIVKQLEMVPYSDPPLVRMASRNPSYETREMQADQVIINGRVIGKWDWT